MNTEPVQTTIKGIENTVTGAATQITATAAVFQALIFFLNSLPDWLGIDLNPAAADSVTIPDSVGQTLVALVTVSMTWWVVRRAKTSIRAQGAELREQVTPWDQQAGAMTPAPTVSPVGGEYLGG